MRVQHNIVAMNSYRNYNNNTSMINKNLEKLSSGYKINRAGDDAAGLAISEKMRAQITGLEGAQKNAKDGISLVQTAEGALTEVHSMLNRMYKLAEQSANGTYDSTTDRNQLQKEVDSLRTEINRIADSSNFNGLNLLDGSLSGNAQVSKLAVTESVAIKGTYTTQAIGAPGIAHGATALASGVNPTNFADLTAADIGKTMDYTVTWKTGAGETKTTKVSLTFQGDGNGIVNTTAADTSATPPVTSELDKNYFTDVNGTQYYLSASGALAATDIATGILAGLQGNEEFTNAFEVALSSTTTNAFQFTAKAAGTAGAVIGGISIDSNFTGLTKAQVWNANADGDVTINAKAYDALQKFDVTTLKVAVSGDTLDEMNNKIFEIDSHKFLVYDNTAGSGLSDTQIKALKNSGIEGLIGIGGTSAASFADAQALTISNEITRVTGMETDIGTNVLNTLSTASRTESRINAQHTDGSTNAVDVVFLNDRLRLSGSALTLQIGDTAAKYNQLDVQIGDIHTNILGNESMKLDAIDISKQDGAQKAMDALKAAINTVSDIRGTLGATQNRLEHTINNLSVMQENIQDAESTIRDTDVADEMMKYTKNSILVQSAQAMLAQANQQPQGVLQLLQ